jgi:hypothetical protein
MEEEEEEANQQLLNPPSNHSDALQHVHRLMQFAETNVPHLQPTLENIHSEMERNWAAANIQKKKQTTLRQFFYHSEIKQKSVENVDQWQLN